MNSSSKGGVFVNIVTNQSAGVSQKINLDIENVKTIIKDLSKVLIHTLKTKTEDDLSSSVVNNNIKSEKNNALESIISDNNEYGKQVVLNQPMQNVKNQLSENMSLIKKNDSNDLIEIFSSLNQTIHNDDLISSDSNVNYIRTNNQIIKSLSESIAMFNITEKIITTLNE